MTQFKDEVEKYELSIAKNHQGFQIGTKVLSSQLKIPVFRLLTPQQKEHFSTTPDKFCVFTLFSLPTASTRYKWFTMVKCENLFVRDFDTYSVLDEKITYGTIREFDVNNLQQFVSAIDKQQSLAISFYAQWLRYFPDYRLDLEMSIENNPFNIGYIPFEKELAKKALQKDGLVIKVIKKIDDDLCLEAITHTPISYMYCPIHLRTEELWNRIPLDKRKYIIKSIFLSNAIINFGQSRSAAERCLSIERQRNQSLKKLVEV